MKRTKTGNRVVVIGSTAPTKDKTVRLPSTQPPDTSHRIVVIKNNEFVGSRPGR
jgi:hypothetical protein